MAITPLMRLLSSYADRTVIQALRAPMRNFTTILKRDQAVKRVVNDWMINSNRCFRTLKQPNNSRRSIYPFMALCAGGMGGLVVTGNPAFNKKGELDRVAAFIKQGNSISALVDGVSLLYMACENGKIDVARLLLESGASPTQRNDLSYRAEWDRYWHEHDHEDRHGATPMQVAVKSGSIELVKLLMDYQAPFDEPDSDGRSPVFVAVRSGYEELALFFIKKGANIMIRDRYDSSLLSMAVRSGQLRVVQELVERGVKVNEKDETGWIALYDAAEEKNSELLNFLLQNGAKEMVNARWLNKWTPLSYAAQSGNIENVKLLIDAGADLSIKYEGMNILELAKKSLDKSESFSGSRRQYSEERKRVIENKRAVVRFLQEILGQSDCKFIDDSSSTYPRPVMGDPFV